jgi:hypothetical protein
VKKSALSIATAISIGASTVAFAAELPTYEVDGFPISPVQLQLLGGANVREQSGASTRHDLSPPAESRDAAIETERRDRRTNHNRGRSLTRASRLMPSVGFLTSAIRQCFTAAPSAIPAATAIRPTAPSTRKVGKSRSGDPVAKPYEPTGDHHTWICLAGSSAEGNERT